MAALAAPADQARRGLEAIARVLSGEGGA